MAPPPAATAAPVRRHAGGANPSRRWTPLRVVPNRTGQPARRRRVFGNRRRVLTVVSVSMVVVSLLAVVVAQALLANGQVRLSSLQHELSLEQSAHREAELAVAQLETPSRIVGAASSQLHMVHPNVVELPYVSLSAPLATPKVTPAPVTPPPASTTAASSASSAGSANTGASTGTASSTTATSTP